MTERASQPVPRLSFGLIMLGATALAFALDWFVMSRLGADAPTFRTGLTALAAASLLTFAPALLSISREHWGVAVLLGGMARALLLLGWCFVAKESDPTLLSRPLMLGAASAAMLLLIFEAAAAIRILSLLDRRRAGAIPGTTA